jgi:UDP-N-acetylglucosamine/UDP-N-acetylgalactosamine diphosphorylase
MVHETAIAARDRVATKLDEFGQVHLLAFWNELNDHQRMHLLTQIDEIDFKALRELYAGRAERQDWQAIADQAHGPPAIRKEEQGDSQIRQKAFAAAESALRDERLAVILVAGGQGTRLGFPDPKGMFPIGPLSGRSLFQMLFDQVLALQTRYRTRIPAYVMTSPSTHEPTVAHMIKNHYWGMPEADVRLFCQGTMPAVDADTGHVLLAEKWELAISPDGHGGMLAALKGSGCLDDIQSRGIDYLFYVQVDNPLAPICDVWTVGNHILHESEMTTMVVPKKAPDEKVGNVVMVDERMMVIEYSDLPPSAANRRKPDGSLELWAGSMAVHVFDAEFLIRSSSRADSLPFHRALKTVSFVDAMGQHTTPSRPNAIKFERFIFDLMPSARNALVVEADAERAFAPLKNASAAAQDTPETTRAAIVRESRRLLKSAGISVDDGVDVEVNPRFAWDASEAAAKLGLGHRVSTPTYFGP